jgi:hypothetical protein
MRLLKWRAFVISTWILSFAQGVSAQAPSDSRERILTALALLDHSRSGHQLLEKAKQLWHVSSSDSLAEMMTWGTASKTDAVLIRHFDPASGAESRERKVTVYLKKDQSMENLVLDLAHELLHAVSRPAWDPYDPSLNAVKYIRAAIEGEGGEVQAVEMECQVALEFVESPIPPFKGPAWGRESRARCHRYWGKNALSTIRRDFYSTGKWKADLVRDLGSDAKELPLLTDRKPSLYSSTGGAPYPAALYLEFKQINHVACENSRRREESFVQAGVSRAPASVSEVQASQAQKTRAFLAARCTDSGK